MTAEPARRSLPPAADLPTTPSLHLERFAELKARLPGRSVPWLMRAREDAAERFAALGLPTMKDEAWHYTNLAGLAKAALAPTPEALGAPAELPRFSGDGARLVFVGGRYRPDLSDRTRLPSNVVIAPLGEAMDRNPELIESHLRQGAPENSLSALNTALMTDGVVIRIPRGTRLDAPVHVVVLGAAGQAVHLRILVTAEAASSATVIEHYLGRGADPSWTNVVTQLAIEERAALRHVKIQDETEAAFHTAKLEAAVAAGASFDSFVLAKGGRLARHEIETALNGEGAGCRLYGVTLARARQHIDNTTVIDHKAPGCTSDELYRAVLDGEARAVFQGRIVVRKGAQKTNAHQLNENLLLSERAAVDTKPELEIHADDVKCGHGATAGALDEQALFYLRARGIGRQRATGMLIEAFVSDLVDRAEGEDVRALLSEAVGGWLPGTALSEAAA